MVGFDPATMTMVTLEQDTPYKYCRNAEFGVCNWVVPAHSDPGFCVACSMNRIIPSLDNGINQARWRSTEVAKHRLVYSLLRLHLPLSFMHEGREEPLVFNFMTDGANGNRIMTGHDNGIITINIAEADEALRTQNKQELGERYRTLLGHFRHESGHYYWDMLIRDSPLIEKFRGLFGDERQDYPTALAAYYENGAPVNWNEYFISPYAVAHPWEDWAETWAHYLHMMDTLETAWSFGIRIDPVELEETAGIRATIAKEPYGVAECSRLIKRWLPLCFAVNSLNRSMGHSDFYPFILSSAVIGKLCFIHGICTSLAQPAVFPEAP